MDQDLRNALADNQVMAVTLRADLQRREVSAGCINWKGRALLGSLEARVSELRAQIQARRAAEVL